MREVHHVALLIGFGAAAVNPLPRHGDVEDLVRAGEIEGCDGREGRCQLIKALGKGVLKVMSKMGISTVASYRGAQVFVAIGLSQALVERYFTGTVSQLGGVGLGRHRPRDGQSATARAYPPDGVPPAAPHPRGRGRVTSGGARASRTSSTPRRSSASSTRRASAVYDIFKQYTDRVDDQTSRLMTLRGLMGFRPTGVTGRLPVPIEEVESVSRDRQALFNTGAMSYGSISQEANETSRSR